MPKSLNQNRAEPSFSSDPTLVICLLPKIISECPTGWWFIEGKCYLYKNVDKRKAKLVTEKEVCNGGTCPKPADDKNSTESGKNQIFFMFLNKNPL